VDVISDLTLSVIGRCVVCVRRPRMIRLILLGGVNGYQIFFLELNFLCLNEYIPLPPHWKNSGCATFLLTVYIVRIYLFTTILSVQFVYVYNMNTAVYDPIFFSFFPRSNSIYLSNTKEDNTIFVKKKSP